MKKFRKILCGVIALEMIIIAVAAYNIKAERKATEAMLASKWFNQYSIIAHAMGAIDGHAYTNSLEAFEYNYSQGTRVFEVDLCLTKDNKLVLNHGWEEHKKARLGWTEFDRTPMMYDEYMNTPILGSYTPLSSLDLLEIMQDYPDIFVVLDWGKDLDYVPEEDKDYIFDLDALIERNRLFIDEVKSVDEGLLTRIIPQIYYEEHYHELDKVYPFENYIYTLYKNFENTTAKEVMLFANNNGIDVITSNLYGTQEVITREIRRQINYDRMTARRMGIYLHTINSVDEYKNHVEDGYKGIYTDNMTENEVKSAFLNETEK